MTRLAWTACLLAASAGTGLCDDDGIHLPAGATTSLTWTRQDAMGFQWDIGGNGMVNDGTNDAYDGGMRLLVDNSTFNSFGTARISADGSEVEIGPWTAGSLRVWRRIRVDAKAGVCRWIDIFENDSDRKVTAKCRHHSNMGDSTQRSRTTSGGAQPGEKDWGFATSGSSDSSSRPSVVHVYAAPDARLKPQPELRPNSDDIYFDTALEVPAGEAVALCFFQAQRRPFSEATKLLEGFDPADHLRDAPPALRRIVVNMPGMSLMLGGIELRRRPETDLLVLADDSEVLGEITNEQFELATEFGPMTLKAERLIGLVGAPGQQRISIPDAGRTETSVTIPAPGGQRVLAVLTDGQIVAGRLISGPVNLTLAGGSKLSVPAEGFAQAAYRIGPKRPEEIAQTVALMVLRSGQRLAFEDGSDTFELLTCHGQIAIRRSDLRSLELDTPAGGLHRALFRNGSVLSGLLTAPRIKGKLALGMPMDLPRQRVLQFLLPGAPTTGDGAKLTLCNGDVLRGRLLEREWTLQSQFGKVVAPAADIAEADFDAAAPGRCTLKLRTGSKIAGNLVGERIGFALAPGPTLAIHVSQISSYRDEGAAERDSEPPARETAPTPPTMGLRPTTMPSTMPGVFLRIRR
ncbi:MAG TPA: hypothetical protein VFJ30_09700 [Phycisphaerae bacterium]|nr:hypothetical protein [Phycisphaerae bacterium]